MTGVLEVVTHLHRPTFVSSTVLLAIGGSLLAAQPSDYSHWLLVVGSAGLMYVSDLGGEAEKEARDLAESVGTTLKAARRDVVQKGGWQGAHASSVIACLLLVVAGLLLES